jgi:hypothetical protein
MNDGDKMSRSVDYWPTHFSPSLIVASPGEARRSERQWLRARIGEIRGSVFAQRLCVSAAGLVFEAAV